MRKLLIIPALLFLGCSTKDVFIPKNTQTKKLQQQTQAKELYDYTKKTLTFRELDLVYKKPKSFIDDGAWGEYEYYTKDGLKLGKFKLINDDLAANGYKLLLIKEKKVIILPYLILNATKNGDNIAIVFENNAMGVYNLNKGLIFYQPSDEVLSVKYLGESPLFYQDLVLFPLLNGNVGIYDLRAHKYLNTLAISEGAVNNNIIFLKIVNNQLFMATPSKLVLFNPNFLIDYKADIKHIVTDGKYLYLFLVNGKIVKLNSNLKKEKEINLKFADYFAPTICKGDIYTVTKRGYLLKITPDLNVTVYTGNNFDTNSPLRLKGCKIYNDDKVYFIE
ncbi:MAG: hypothetical protein GXO01_00890 [Epsilonproteobacteria bacterium]|nr:hypothetical protein [Campylobacterota bacterium]